MKLKKIASLMLAGVMAVSMLTACGNKADDNNGGNDTEAPEQLPTSTTASVLRENLNGRARRDVTAVSNGDLDTALQSAVDDYYTANMLKDYWNVFDITDNKSGDVRNHVLGEAVIGDNEDSIIELNNNTDKKTKTAVEVYVVNKSVSDNYILEQLADKINQCFDSNDDYPTMSADQEYDYDYEISASIVTVDGFNSNIDSGLKFVAFSITKTVTEYV